MQTGEYVSKYWHFQRLCGAFADTFSDKAFYNTHIEDFWIPFFANSTNITHSRMEIHRTGYAWRYVRASMTLAGLLPPLSDNGNRESGQVIEELRLIS